MLSAHFFHYSLTPDIVHSMEPHEAGGVRLGFYEVMRLPSLLSNTDATNEAVRRDTMPLLG